MHVLIAADHRGFELKERLKPWLIAQGHQVTDCGSATLQPEDDYPMMSFALAEEVVKEQKAQAILCCGSGVGASIAANKVKGARCGLGFLPQQVLAARRDDNINILALAADYVTQEAAQELIETFLATPFSEEPRYQRRLGQITQREQLAELK